MKIFIAGCFHSRFPKKLQKIANTCDYVLSTGDLGGSEELRRLIFKNWDKGLLNNVERKKLKKLILSDYQTGAQIINQLDHLKVPVYLIDGNWDFTDTKYEKKKLGLKLKSYPEIIKKKENIHYFGHGIRKWKSLNIYTHGGLMLATIFSTKQGGMDAVRIRAYKKYHARQTKELFKRKVKNLDVFIAHCPPYGIFDKVIYKGKNPMNGKHVGFKPYNEYIKKYKPKLFICGHMHEHQGIKKLGRTTILSHGPAQDGKAAIVGWNNGKFKIQLIQ
jgi:Icc-related predicted phosphoesterase